VNPQPGVAGRFISESSQYGQICRRCELSKKCHPCGVFALLLVTAAHPERLRPPGENMTSTTTARPPRTAAIAKIVLAAGAIAVSAIAFHPPPRQRNHCSAPALPIQVHMPPARCAASTARKESAVTVTKFVRCTTQTASCSLSTPSPTTVSTTGEPTCRLVRPRCSNHSSSMSARHPAWVAVSASTTRSRSRTSWSRISATSDHHRTAGPGQSGKPKSLMTP
jgi:hypothetical protein